ncbi:hypothetical protein F5B20DRAFT_586101 [Whalleya microplaca]|nr:hypothetical protein F5B20DRAFT_586101 [Whalleya microplaca]
MDPFTLSVSIAGLASLSIELIKLTKKYVDGVGSSGREEVEFLHVQLEALRDPLEELAVVLRSDAICSSTFSSNSGLYIAQQHCMRQLQSLLGKLQDEPKSALNGTQESNRPDKNLQSRTRSFFKQLTWPFKSDEIKAICVSLQHKVLSQSHNEVMVALQRQEHNIKALSESIPENIDDVLQQIQGTRELISINTSTLDSMSSKLNELQIKSDITYFKELLQWVSPGGFQQRHEAMRALRVEGTNLNLLCDKKIKSWISAISKRRQVCCFGKPGAGKSVFCSAMIDHLRYTHEQHTEILVCSIYFEYQCRKEQTIEHVIRSILRQALEKARGVPDGVARAYQDGGQGLKLEEILDLVEQTLGLFKETFMCFDALDECNDMTQLLRVLCRFPTTRVFVTGRCRIRDHVRRAYPKPILRRIKAHKDDIRLFLVNQLEKDSWQRPGLMRQELRDEILQKLVDTANGLFLLPALHITNILSENTIKKRKKALSTLSDCLEGAYDATMNRIKAQNKADAEQALDILAWVYYAQQPLSVTELRHALAIEIGSEEFDEDDLPSTSFISSCLGLVECDRSQGQVKLVHFTHFTLYEYFHKVAKDVLGIGHDILAQKCLTYLSYEETAVPLQGAWEGGDVRHDSEPHGSLELNDDTHGAVVNFNWESHLAALNEEYPFFIYASTQWGNHARGAGVPSQKLIDLALEYLLMDDSNLEPSIANFLLYTDILYCPSQDCDRCLQRAPSVSWVAPRLHIVAFFGLRTIWSVVRKQLPDLDPCALDGRGMSALIYACFSEDDDMMGLFQHEVYGDWSYIKFRMTVCNMAVTKTSLEFI